MTPWIPIVAIIVAVQFVVFLFFAIRVLARVARSRIGREPLELSMVQRRAWVALGIGVPSVVAAAAVVASRGAEAYGDDPNLRMTAMGIVFGGALLIGLAMLFTRAGPDEVHIDERDRQALSFGPSLQFAAAIITLVVWTIWQQETFRAAGAIPVDYIHLTFFSVFLAGMLAYPLGILVGYVAVDLHAQG